MDNNDSPSKRKNYIGYDYKTITVNSEKLSFYLDAYENFGWIPDATRQLGFPMTKLTSPAQPAYRTVSVDMRRERKIPNKAELTRLQQHFEACMDEMDQLERSTSSKACIYSLIVALIGTSFMAGSVFAVTHEPPIIWLCVLLGLPGLLVWGLTYPLYRRLVQNRASEVRPLIDRKTDEVHDICEKGSTLLH